MLVSILSEPFEILRVTQTFGSEGSIPAFSITSLSRISHFEASVTRAYICAGEALRDLELYMRDLKEPP